MSGPASRIRVRNADSVTEVEFLDRNILDEAYIHAIGDEIASIIEASPSPRLLLSFKGVEHLSSAALGTLITINNRIRSRSGQLRLAEIDPQILEVFVITKLNRIFQIHETCEDARKSFTS